MCGFQSPRQGFFYFPDMSSGKQSKERSNMVVISVLEGVTNAKDLETEFNGFFDSWKCTARPISPSQFIMRFPNRKEVERACCFGKHLPLKLSPAVVSISPWSASVGAKAVMQKAWVRVKNVPEDKRCPENVAYAGSLVGVTLEVDQATLYKPEYARILLGCREVDNIPSSAEGVLGDQFYDFFYEVEKIVVGGTKKDEKGVTVDSSSSPTFAKKARFDQCSSSSGFGGGGSQSVAANFSPQSRHVGSHKLATVSELDDEDEEVEVDNELLIHTIARENAELINQNESDSETERSYESELGDMVSGPDNSLSRADVGASKPGAWAIISTPVPPSPQFMLTHEQQVVSPIPPVSDYVSWPSMPVVMEVEASTDGGDGPKSAYTVESPSGSPIHVSGVLGCGGVELPTRNQYGKLSHVEKIVAERSRKRNLEGLLKLEDKAKFQEGIGRVMQVAASLVDRSRLRIFG